MRKNILPSDMDPSGNVTLYDHESGAPVPIVLHSSDASHAMMIEPDRYSMEPFEIDEGEVEKRMAEIRAKREAAARAPQDVVDRKAAIASIINDRLSAESQAEAEEEPPAKPPSYRPEDYKPVRKEQEKI